MSEEDSTTSPSGEREVSVSADEVAEDGCMGGEEVKEDSSSLVYEVLNGFEGGQSSDQPIPKPSNGKEEVS